jgi:hypothetical protein
MAAADCHASDPSRRHTNGFGCGRGVTALRSDSSDYKGQLLAEVGQRIVGNLRGDFETPRAKMLAEKEVLERRLDSLHPPDRSPKGPSSLSDGRSQVRKPDEPRQVWSGRGKRPRWVTEKLASGLALEDLSIWRGSSVAMPNSPEGAIDRPEPTNTKCGEQPSDRYPRRR